MQSIYCYDFDCINSLERLVRRAPDLQDIPEFFFAEVILEAIENGKNGGCLRTIL
ncbi:uncharacterized protein G2W53_026537 [Senna tora]|uniref:Uncharacterized protein n=1 Tax=Senna tora TaxID=362788 RepID=A0A834TFA1_9FABA|nr:uncharacterized protein G2W53_026537 [Senna tora]